MSESHYDCPCMEKCPLHHAMQLIGGKWKLLIIRNLRVRPSATTLCGASWTASATPCCPPPCGSWRGMDW